MKQKYIAIVLIVAGVALAAWGYNIYDSAGSQISRSLTGDISVKAWAGMGVGVILVVIGAFKVK